MDEGTKCNAQDYLFGTMENFISNGSDSLDLAFSPGTICNNMPKQVERAWSIRWAIVTCHFEKSTLHIFDVSAAGFTHKAAFGSDAQFQNHLFSNCDPSKLLNYPNYAFLESFSSALHHFH